ncbi:hypothetical protein [Flavobacterium filum]|uniref:hypothetical protein n=1 Tax=Flavobacterium filum TaxID=370974 RepID=UPI000409A9C7|nr:hypothetical protein [Flavobacterium filum]
MRFLLHIFFLVSFSAFAQFDHELKKKDSVFIYFSESENQKIYSKILEKNSKNIKKVSYIFNFSDGKSCSFFIDETFNYDSNGNKVLKTYKLQKSYLRKNKHKIINYDDINEKGIDNFILFLQLRKVYIVDLEEKEGKHYIARGVIFSFVANE